VYHQRRASLSSTGDQIGMAAFMSVTHSIDVKAELKAATDRILASKGAKKLVVAGPGAGKTYLFGELLKGAKGRPNQRLVLTFISALKGDLDRNLGEMSQVFTLHGYCQHLLRRNEKLRCGLSEKFRCYPGLRRLIPQDWRFLRGSDSPSFIRLMRELDCTDEQAQFYLDRSNYYDALDFDDSVYRVLSEMENDASLIPEYELVLIDEFQDFNRMEAGIIEMLSNKSQVVISGDDDQALYSQLRSASWEHIRAHHAAGEYEVFELPFCMRCPEVIVGAVNEIVERAIINNNLNGRISKPYRYYQPLKGADSEKYPKIDLIETTVQRTNANYFGRYIEKCIRGIPEADVKAAAEKNEPVALIIGNNPYRRAVEEHLLKVGLLKKSEKELLTDRQKALQILHGDPTSNLGWRLILSAENQGTARDRVKQAFEKTCPLVDVISKEQREAVLIEAGEHPPVDFEQEDEETTQSVAVTSYEGSKGRSAQYVFLIGVHSGEIPINAKHIKDIEICRFLVGLTRTKKQCSILYAKNAMGSFKDPSEFVGWISANRFRKIMVDSSYWK
jgi:superfamily I DNA/RNA helicase